MIFFVLMMVLGVVLLGLVSLMLFFANVMLVLFFEEARVLDSVISLMLFL